MEQPHICSTWVQHLHASATVPFPCGTLDQPRPLFAWRFIYFSNRTLIRQTCQPIRNRSWILLGFYVFRGCPTWRRPVSGSESRGKDRPLLCENAHPASGFLIFTLEYTTLHRNTPAIVLCYFHDISSQQPAGACSTIH